MGDYFLSVQKRDGRFVVDGSERVFVGHRVDGEGTFVDWEWTGSELVIRNDRYGLCPAYYCSGPNEFLISTSIHQLIAHGASTELDYDALAVFFRYGTFLGEDTPFKAIRALPPGVTFVWSGAPAHPSGKIILGEEHSGLSFDDACTRYGELFSEAVKKRSDFTGDIAVALSGGMDSRHILLELCHLGRKPKVCVTAGIYSGHSSEDLELAEQVAQLVGVPHLRIDQPGHWVRTEVQKLQAVSLCTMEHNWGMGVGPFLEGKAAALFDGLAGDVLSDCRHIVTPARHEAFRAGRFAEIAEDLLGDEGGGLRFLAPELARHMTRERAVRRLAAECAQYAHATNPAAAFTFWNRTRRTISLLPHAVWNRSIPVLTPYLDHTLFDFLIGLPVELVGNYIFHAETILRRYPRAAHLPFFSGPCRQPDRGAWLFRKRAFDLFTYGLRSFPSSFVSMGYLISRLMRLMGDSSYSASVMWIGPAMIYALELGRCVNGANARIVKNDLASHHPVS